MHPTRLLRRGTPICLAPLLALVLAACGVNATSQVRAKVQQFARAANRHDYATICTDVLSARLLSDIAAGGVSCPRALSIALGSVRGAGLTVGTITVKGSRASVLTVSQAHGEKTALTTVELIQTPAGWRVDSLGDAAGG